MKRLDAVDGLRAVAMTMVVAGHCYLVPIGWMGVWLFYVVSGYVIMRGFVLQPDAAAGGGHADFLARRCSRIVPLYLLYGVTLGVAASDDALPYLLTFTYNGYLIALYHGSQDALFPVQHLWSLSVEQQFYLLFALVVLGRPRASQTRTLVGLVVTGFAARCVASVLLESIDGSPTWKSFAVYMSTPCHVDAFAAGALIACATGSPSTPGVQDALRRRVGALALLAATGYFAFYAGLGLQRHGFGAQALQGVFWGDMFGDRREVWLYTVVTLVASYLVLAAQRPTGWARVLAHPGLAGVGRISYGAYVFHAGVLWVAADAFGVAPNRLNHLPVPDRVLLFGVVMVFTLALAVLSFRYFEEPIRRVLKRPVGVRA